MKVTDKLKQLIFKQLYKELGNAEIIPYQNSIWFINREEKYWYFEFENTGTLYWRYSFFPSLFTIFSLEREDFEPILSSWVEEVLNHRVSTTNCWMIEMRNKVEDVLNHRVSTTTLQPTIAVYLVEEVLNHRVSTTYEAGPVVLSWVEDVLNHKVSTMYDVEVRVPWKVEEVLNHKVLRTGGTELPVFEGVENILNQ